MADETHGSSLTWLRGDMHNHCEDHDLVAAHLEGANEQLDFVALTNHAQKPIFFEQHRMVEKARLRAAAHHRQKPGAPRTGTTRPQALPHISHPLRRRWLSLTLRLGF